VDSALFRPKKNYNSTHKQTKKKKKKKERK
jgi:hypothetical protein